VRYALFLVHYGLVLRDRNLFGDSGLADFIRLARHPLPPCPSAAREGGPTTQDTSDQRSSKVYERIEKCELIVMCSIKLNQLTGTSTDIMGGFRCRRALIRDITTCITEEEAVPTNISQEDIAHTSCV
jgi:hypothetical protein